MTTQQRYECTFSAFDRPVPKEDKAEYDGTPFHCRPILSTGAPAEGGFIRRSRGEGGRLGKGQRFYPPIVSTEASAEEVMGQYRALH